MDTVLCNTNTNDRWRPREPTTTEIVPAPTGESVRDMKSPSQPDRSLLLQLPLEIRHQIYRYLLSVQYTGIKYTRLTAHDELPFHAFEIAILSTCRQINLEATYILRKNHFVFMTFDDLDWDQSCFYTSIRTLSIWSDNPLSRHCALKLQFSNVARKENDHDAREPLMKPAARILAGEDLSVLWKQVVIHNDYHDTDFLSALSLSVDLNVSLRDDVLEEDLDFPAYHRRTATLLESMRCLHSVGSLSIDQMLGGMILHPSDHHDYPTAPCFQEIYKSVRKAKPSTQELVEIASRWKNNGDIASREMDWSLAIAHYNEALKVFNLEMEIYNCEHTLTQFPNDFPDAIIAEFVLGIYTNKIATLVRLGEFIDAHTWSSAVLMYTGCFWNIDADGKLRSKAHFWNGLACEGMEMLEGTEMLKSALKQIELALAIDPGDIAIKFELDRLRGRIRDQADNDLEEGMRALDRICLRELAISL